MYLEAYTRTLFESLITMRKFHFIVSYNALDIANRTIYKARSTRAVSVITSLFARCYYLINTFFSLSSMVFGYKHLPVCRSFTGVYPLQNWIFACKQNLLLLCCHFFSKLVTYIFTYGWRENQSNVIIAASYRILELTSLDF